MDQSINVVAESVDSINLNSMGKQQRDLILSENFDRPTALSFEDIFDEIGAVAPITDNEGYLRNLIASDAFYPLVNPQWYRKRASTNIHTNGIQKYFIPFSDKNDAKISDISYITAKNDKIAVIGLIRNCATAATATPQQRLFGVGLRYLIEPAEIAPLHLLFKFGNVADFALAGAQIINFAQKDSLAQFTPPLTDYARVVVSRPQIAPLAISPKLTPLPVQRFMEIIGNVFGLLPTFYHESEVENVLYMYGLFSAAISALRTGADSSETTAKVHVASSLVRRARFRAAMLKRRNIALNELTSLMSIAAQKFGIKPQIRPHNAELFLAALPLAQAKAIRTEHEQRVKLAKSAELNKCAHRKIPLMSDKINEFLPKEFIAASNSTTRGLVTTIIPCKVCGFNLICPHNLALNKQQRADFADQMAAMKPFLETRAISGKFHCNICGEAIVSSYEDYFTKSKTSTEYRDELSSTMWSEFMTTLRNTVTNMLVNPASIANSFIGATYSSISDIQTQLTRTKTNSIDDIKNKLRLFISIYSYTYVIYVAVNQKDIGLTFRKIKGEPKLPDLFKFALISLIESKSIILNSLSGITPEFIKNKMIEAFKQIMAAGSTVDVPPETVEKYVPVLFSPIFQMIWFMKHWGKQTPAPTLADAIALLGVNVPKKGQKRVLLQHLFANIDQPAKVAALKIAPFTWKKPVISFDAAADFKLSANSLISIATAFTGNYLSAASLASGRPRALTDYAVSNLRPYVNGGAPGFRFARVDVKLGEIYDISGNPHDFSILITPGGEIPVKKAIDAPVITDHKCAVCGILRSESADLDEAAIRSQLELKVKIANVLTYFSYQCPLTIGLPHKWAGPACATCGYGKLTDEEFYNKYKDVFARETADVPVVRDVVEPAKQPKFPQLDKYEFNYSNVVALCNKLKLNQYQFAALCSVEGMKFGEITNGAFTPSPATVSNNTRYYKLISLVTQMMVEWGKLKNIAQFPNPEPHLVNIVRAAKIQPAGYAELQKLSDYFEYEELDFMTACDYIREHKKPRQTVEFIIEFLAVCGLKMMSDSDVGREFATWFFGNILDQDRLTTAYEDFSWSIFAKKGETFKHEEQYNANLDDTAGVEEEQDETEPAPLENNFDIEDVNEENSNGAGADLGLD